MIKWIHRYIKVDVTISAHNVWMSQIHKESVKWVDMGYV